MFYWTCFIASPVVVRCAVGCGVTKKEHCSALWQRQCSVTNKIYDYEIAALVTVACDEEAWSVEEMSLSDATVFDADDKIYIDAREYARELDEFIDGADDSYFTWGRNAALGACKVRSSLSR